MAQFNNDKGARDGQGCDSGAIQLNPLDNIMPRFHASLILTFGIPPDQTFQHIHGILQQSLDQTCDAIPVLGSRIYSACPNDQDPSTGRLEVRKGYGWRPKVVFNDLSSSLPDYEDLMMTGFPQELMTAEQLLPTTSWNLTSTGIPVVICQANFVASGLLLAVGLYHSVIDGAGAALFLKLWAQNAKALQGISDLLPSIRLHPDSYDLSMLEKICTSDQGHSPFTANKAKAEDWRLLGLFPPVALSQTIETKTVDGKITMPKMASKMFYMSSKAFEQLASVAKSTNGSSPFETKITSNDALMALLWRCSIRARAKACSHSTDEYRPDTLAYLDTTINGRSLIGDPLPWSYMGTLIVFATASMTVGELISDSTSIGYIAHEFRNAVELITKTHVCNAYNLAACLQDYEHVPQHPFATMKGTEVFVTSWITFDILECSFGPIFSGEGRPDCGRIPRLQFEGYSRRIVVLPRQASGGLELLIELQDEEMKMLESDKEFMQYAKVV